jgi:DNA-binding MarR family transcriptional regulator
MAPVVARARFMMGERAGDWSLARAAAWEGLLELAGRLRREAERELAAYGDLSVSMLGIMGRLATTERRTLRQTALAGAMGLSLGRVSRIVDVLERRGYVRRTPCPRDGRATNVTLTAAGARATTAAQAALCVFAEDAFFTPLTDAEVAQLAAVFTRLVGAMRDREPAHGG